MKKTDVIIIDGDPPARHELQTLLSSYPDIRMVGEADCFKDALRLIEDSNPDCIFMDIQLGDESIFDFIDTVDINSQLVFVTSFKEGAIRAFEVNAVDYLLKPVNPERLRITMERLLAKQSQWENTNNSPGLQYEDTLFEPVGDSLEILKLSDIVSITAEGDYTRISKEDRELLVTKSLKKWEEILPANHFIRIHRSTIVNMNFISRIEKWFRSSYRIYMRNKETHYLMSRRYAARLKRQSRLIV